ncbi:MAG TPA: PH domain-containing protein, partial [Roseiflexaceae bacterium]|nr:PH domain-containing protein [Roseiflexaceae bacterium]
MRPWIALALMLLALAACWWPFQYLRAAFSSTPDTWQLDLRIYGWIVLLLGLLLVAAMLAYRVAAALTLGYELDRNGLYISWLGNRAIVPLDQIESVEAGASGLRMPWGPLQQVGYWWGRAYDADRPVHLFSTSSPRRALLINTTAGGYVVSPADFDTFVQDLEQRRNLGATKPLAPTIEAGRMFLYDFWNDRTVRWLMIVAVLLNLLALALLAWRYPDLPATLEM